MIYKPTHLTSLQPTPLYPSLWPPHMQPLPEALPPTFPLLGHVIYFLGPERRHPKVSKRSPPSPRPPYPTTECCPQKGTSYPIPSF